MQPTKQEQLTRSQVADNLALAGARAQTHKILTFLADQYVLSDEQLTKLRGCSPNTNRRWRRNLKQAGIIECEVMDSKVCIWLTRKALGVLVPTYSYVKPSIVKLEHNLAVADARIGIERFYEQNGEEIGWHCQRFLHQLYSIPVEGEVINHIPNAEVDIGDGRKVAVQVERTQKHYKRSEALYKDLCAKYDQVWVICNETTHRQLVRLIDEFNLSNIKLSYFDSFTGPPSNLEETRRQQNERARANVGL